MLFNGSLSCMDLLSFSGSLIFLLFHNFNSISNTARWSFDFEVLLGLCKINVGMLALEDGKCVSSKASLIIPDKT